MKKLSFIILCYFIVACRVISPKEQEKEKVEIFVTENISIVKSKFENIEVFNKYQQDSTFTFEKSVEILEKLTDIHADKEQNYFANKIIDKVIIGKWNDWLIKNRKILVWEKGKNRINRKDKDIYSGKLLPHLPK